MLREERYDFEGERMARDAKGVYHPVYAALICATVICTSLYYFLSGENKPRESRSDNPPVVERTDSVAPIETLVLERK